MISVVYRNLLRLAFTKTNFKFGKSLNLILLPLSSIKLAHKVEEPRNTKLIF